MSGCWMTVRFGNRCTDGRRDWKWKGCPLGAPSARSMFLAGNRSAIPLSLDRRHQLFRCDGRLIVLDFRGAVLEMDRRVVNTGAAPECLLHARHAVTAGHPRNLQS